MKKLILLIAILGILAGSTWASIIAINKQPSVTPAQLVSQDKIANGGLYQHTVSVISKVFNDIWNNPDYTPQQMWAAWGNDSVALMQEFQVEINAAQTANAQYVPPSENAWIVNADTNGDGGVTLIAANSTVNGI